MFKPGNRFISTLVGLSATLLSVGSIDVAAHNLQTRMAYMFLDKTTQACIDARIANDPTPAGCQALSPAWTPGTPVLKEGDELGIITKVVPDPSGTTTGVGGHIDFYVPNGVQVVDVAYLIPDGSGGLVKAPMKGQSPIAVGAGPIGAKATTQLMGLSGTYKNVNGINEAPVVASTGLHRGTIAGVYGDTGIFFSEDPDTAWGTWQDFVGNSANRNACGSTAYDLNLPAGGKTITNNSGDVIVPCNKWDAGQLFAWGVKGTTCSDAGCTMAPIVDYGDGRGNAPWGFASGVAGPQSGYAWNFDWNQWRASAKDAAAMQAAMADTKIGPWKRIQYPGSRVSFDQPGSASTVLGQASIDASSLGAAVSALTKTTDQTITGGGPKAIRYAVGQLTQNRPEYVWVKIKINDLAKGPNNFLDASGCPVFRGDTFGGDAGGTDNGKDHLWRYYEPTVFKLNGCVAAAKPAEVEFATVGDTVKYDIKAYNLGTQTLKDVTFSDALPSSLQFLGASPAQSSGPSPLVWNVGNWVPGQKFEATLTVKILSTGSLTNCLTISGKDSLSNQPVTQSSCDVTPATLTPYLVQEKTANPSSMGPGGNVIYTLTVKNIGTGPTGSPVTLTDFLPSGFTFSASPAPTAMVNGASVTPTVTATNPSQPVFSLPAAIAAGQSAVLSFTATTSATLAPGPYCNTYTVTQNGIPLTSGSLGCVTLAGGQIGDTLFRDWNGNGVQDSGEEGMPGVTVTLAGAASKTAVTDANGNYLFVGLAAGSYTVSVPAPGGGGVPSNYNLTSMPPGVAGSNSNTSFPLSLGTNEKYATADFGYQPGGAGKIGDMVFDDKNGDGVFDGSDVGIGGVTLRLYEDTNGNGKLDSGDNQIATQITDGAGNYQFTGLDPARSYIVAPDDGPSSAVKTYFGASSYHPTTRNPWSVKPADFTAASNNVTTADFGYNAQTPGSIGDQVFIDGNRDGVYNAGETGLPNITVKLYLDSNGNGALDPGDFVLSTTSTDANGLYSFGSLAPGNYLVEVDSQDPDLPAGYLPPQSLLAVGLTAGQQRTDIDFPFVNALAKTVDQATSAAGGTLTYTLTPSYPGYDLLSSVGVTDSIPAGTTYVSASANQGGLGVDTDDTPDGVIDEVDWDLGANEPGAIGAKGGATPPSDCNLQTVVIADRDTFLESGAGAGNNYGITPQLAPKSGLPALLHFPITSATLPANAIISQIQLRLNVTKSGAGRSGDVREAVRDWAEGNKNGTACDSAVGGATYNKANCLNPGTNWGNGTNFSPSDYGSPLGSVSATANVVQYLTSTSSTNTSFFNKVKGWLANETNKGLVILAAGGDIGFSARETAGSEPAIVITYTANGCTVTKTIQETGNGEVPDTWVDQANPNNNNGSNQKLTTKTSGSQQSALVKFDLSSIPAGTTLSSATLGLTVTDVPKAGAGGHTDTVYKMTTGWAEGTVNNICNTTAGGATWLKADCKTTGGAGWAGTSFSSSDYNGTALGAINGSSKGTKSLAGSALLAAVQDWVNTPANNKGLAIVGTSADTNTVRYASGENTTTGSRPKLTLIYTIPPNGATGTNTISAGPSLVQNGDTVKITMKLTNTSGSAVTGVSPASLTIGGSNGASATCGAASPTSATVPASGSATFTWTCAASVPTNGNGQIRFSAGASNGTDSWDAASSNSVIVARPLTFQVTVKNPPGVDVVTNSGTLNAGTVSVASNTVDSRLSGGLGDRVWADLNGNGQQDAGEPGLAGVRVYIDSNDDGVLNWTDSNANGVWDTGEGERWVATDGSGTYNIYGLAADTYKVRIDPRSYPAGSTPTTPTLKSVTLTSQTPYVNDADFGLIPPGTGSIGDTVWLDSDANGTQGGGEAGLPGIIVKLYRDLDGNGTIDATDLLIGTATTDATGNYSFTGLPIGTGAGSPVKYLVQVDETNSTVPLPYPYSDGPTTASLSAALTRTTPANNPKAVSLYPGNANVLDADFGYNYNWTGEIGDTVFYDTNFNGNQDVGEAGADGVTLALVWDQNGNGVADFGEPAIAVATTIADGKYRFVHLPPGRYVVQVAGQTVESPTHAGVYGTMVPTASYGEDYAVTLAAGAMSVLDADFGFAEAARVQGNVFYDANNSGVFDAGELGLGDGSTKVTVFLSGTDLSGKPVNKSTFTSTSGAYSFLVPPGNYTVTYTLADTGYPRPTTATILNANPVAGQTVSNLDFGVTYNGSLGNWVWNDANGDGRQTGGEVGIAGVTVQLYASNATLLRSVATDANGNYSFGGLADGNYVVKVIPPSGFTPTGEGEPGTSCLLPTNTCDNTISRTVSTGAADDTVDFGYTKPGYKVSGNVWNDNGKGGGTAGNGIKDGSEPDIADVKVCLYQSDGVTTFSCTKTDVSGNYSFPGVPNGSYFIKVDPSTLGSSAFVQTFDPDGAKDNRTAVTVSGADVTNKNFGYQEKLGSIAGTVCFGTGNGQCDAGESPVAGVTLKLYKQDDTGVFKEVPDKSATTDANGAYSFTGLQPGNYQIIENAPASFLGSLADVDGGNPDNIGVTLTTGANITGRDFEETASIGDYVWFDANQNGIQDADEKGIAGVTVNLLSSGGTLLQTTKTDGSGHYRFTGVSGSLQVEFVPPAGYTLSPLNTGSGTLADSFDSDPNPATGKAAVTIAGASDVTIDAGLYLADKSKPARIGDFVWYDGGSGTPVNDGNGIQDAGEPGLAGVTVRLLDPGNSYAVLATTVSDGKGFYEFAGLKAGTYVVEFVAPTGYSRSPQGQGGDTALDSDADATTGRTASITLTAGQDLTRVDAGLYIPDVTPARIGDFVWYDRGSGTSANDGNGIQDTGEPGIPGVVVHLYDATGTTLIATTKTDATGHYGFGGLAAGGYVVEFVKPVGGYSFSTAKSGSNGAIDSDANTDTGRVAVTLTAGQTNIDIDAGLYVSEKAPISIGDFVWKDANGDRKADKGERLANVQVVLYDNLGFPLARQTTTNADANYTFTGLAAGGSYRVAIDASTLGNLIQIADPDQVTDPNATLDNRTDLINQTLSTVNADFGYLAPKPAVSIVKSARYRTDGSEDTTDVTADDRDTQQIRNPGTAYFKITVTNTGNLTLTEVMTHDARAGDCEQPPPGGTLIPGQTFIFTCQKSTVNGSVENPDLDYINEATVDGQPVDLSGNPVGSKVTASDSTAVDVIHPAIAITKDLLNAGGKVESGTTATFSISVTNTGDVALTDVAVTDTLAPACAKSIGTLAIDATYNYTCSLASVMASFVNTAQVSGKPPVGANVTDTASAEVPVTIPGLSISKSTSTPYIKKGGTASFNITVTNTGSAPLTNLTVTDASAPNCARSYTTLPALVSLDAGASYTYPEPCTLAGVPASFTNTAVASSGTLSASAVAEVTVIDLTINKVANDDYPVPKPTLHTGTLVSFNYLVTNASLVSLTDVSISDDKGISVTCPKTILSAGESMTCFGYAQATLDYYKNVGTVSAKAPDGFLITASDFSEYTGIDPAVIGNYVWLDENGDGVQDAGEPGIANVKVELKSGSTTVQTAYTDANGGYLFTNVVPGSYTVVVTPPAGLNPTYDEDSGIVSPDGQTPVMVLRGAVYLTADFGYNWVPPADSKTPGPTSSGAIGDRVWIDANGNGIQDPGEAGIGNVAVTLYYDPDGKGVYDTPFTSAKDANGTTISSGTTQTDAAGNYLFDGLPAGAYSLAVTTSTLPSGLSWTQTGDPDGASSTDSKTTTPIVLAPGDVFVNADFGYQPSQGSRIGDTIYYDVDADQAQDSDEPGIAGVTVALLDGAGKAIATTSTDANGHYFFTGLPAGSYKVVVTDTDNVLGRFQQSADPDGNKDNQSLVSVDGRTDKLDRDFGYTAFGEHQNYDEDDGTIGDTIFLDRNGNGTYDPGEGLQGVTVDLYDTDHGATKLATTTTNANGTYTFGRLSINATYVVKVDTTTLPNGGSGLANSVDPDVGIPSRSTVPPLNGKEWGGINMQQDFGYVVDSVNSSPATIGGTLWKDANANGTLDATETERLSGITLALLDFRGYLVAKTTTDANGDYLFSGIPAGTYRVRVTDTANYLEGWWHSLGISQDAGTDGTSKADPFTLTVLPGETNTHIDFGYYHQGAALGNRVWKDATGNGIQVSGETGLPDVPVKLVITWPTTGTPPTTTLIVTTGASGGYSFGNLLLDESFNGSGSGQPTHTISIPTRPAGYLASPTGKGTSLTDSDNPAGTTASVLKGQLDTNLWPNPADEPAIASYDFGYIPMTASISILKTASDGTDSQSLVNPGTASFTITVTNTGNMTLKNVQVTDALTPGCAKEIGTLDAGASNTYTCSSTASSVTGSFENVAAVSGQPYDGETPVGNPVTASDTTAVLVRNQADLAITKTDGSATYIAGNSIEYTIVVTNIGSAAVEGATVSDTLPAAITGATWSATYSAGASGPASGIGNINATVDLPNGGQATFTVSGTLAAGATGDLTNTATVTAPVNIFDPDTTNNSATDTDTQLSLADLAITKTDGSTTYLAGGSIAYTIVVTNKGPAAVTGATVSDTLPAEITGASWTTAYSAGASGPASGTGNLAATVNLPNGGKATFTLSGTIKADATVDPLVNTAKVTAPSDISDPDTTNNSATDSDSRQPEADLEITKTDNRETYIPGRPIVYTLVVTNKGPDAVTGATVSDNLPTEITGASWTAAYSPGASGSPSSGTGNLAATANLPKDGTATFTVSGRVQADATGDLTNTATVTPPATIVDPTPGNNSATDTDTANPQADLIVEKNGPVLVVDTAGNTITYTVTVSNAGPSAADGAVFGDDPESGGLEGPITWTCGNAVGGAVCPSDSGSGALDATNATIASFPAGSSLTYTIKGTAPESGTVTNTARVKVPDGAADPDLSNNDDEVTTGPGTPPDTADLAILKYGPARVAPSAEVTYILVVTNAGFAAADGAVLTDPAVTGLTKTGTPSCQAAGGAICPVQDDLTNGLLEGAGVVIPTLPSGGSLRFVVTATAPDSNSGIVTVINTASIDPPTGVDDPDEKNNSASAKTEIRDMNVLEADLALVKTGPATVEGGGTVIYKLVVSNTGPDAADGATVFDLVPSVLTGVTWVCGYETPGAMCPDEVGGAQPGDLNSGMGNVYMTIPTFPAGSSLTITVTGFAPTAASGSVAFVNSAQVIPPVEVNDPYPSNNPGGPVITQITSEANPALTLVKSADKTSYSEVGETIEYSYLLKNTGNVPLYPPYAVKDNKVSVTCSVTSPLAPNDTATCTASHITNQDDVDAGSIVNNATAEAYDAETGGQLVTSNQDTKKVNGPVANRTLSLVKSANPVSYSAEGDKITYGYLLKNTGKVTLYEPYGVDDDKVSVLCPNIPVKLAPNETVTCTVDYYVTDADVEAGSIVNHATATAMDALMNGGEVTSNRDRVTVRTATAIALVKGATETVLTGGSLTYTLTLTNSGTQPSDTSLVVQDLLPTGVTYGSATRGTNVDTVACTAADQLLTCRLALTQPLAAAGPGTAPSATFTLNTTAPASAGSITNYASARVDGTSAEPGDPGSTCPMQTVCASAPTTVYAPPTVVKSFNPAAIPVGGTSVLTITVTNPNSVELTGVSIGDSYAGTLVNNAAGSVACTDGGSATRSGGEDKGTTVGFTSGALMPGKTCTITQSVTATRTTANTTDAPTATGPVTLTGVAASATLTVYSPPAVTKSFSPATIPVGGTATMTITVTNPNAVDLTGVSISDSYAGTLVNNAAGSVACTNGGSATLSDGADTGTRVGFMSGTLKPGKTCTITQSVTATSATTNTTDAPTATGPIALTGVAAKADLKVYPPPTVAKSFSPAAIAVGGTSLLTITLSNGNDTLATLSTDLVDTLPANVKLANPANLGGTCTGTKSGTAGDSTLTFGKGGTIPANSNCTLTANVTASTAGSYKNSIPAGGLKTDRGNNAEGASADLKVYTPLTVAKDFNPEAIPVDGISVLTITLSNGNDTDATLSGDLVDTLPANVTLANATFGGSCTGTKSGTAGSDKVTFASGGTIPASGNCTLTANVTASAAGSYINNIPVGALKTDLGNNAVAAKATLSARAADLVVEKNGPVLVGANGTITYMVTVSNAGPSAAVGAVFSDDPASGGLESPISWTCGNAVGGAECPTVKGEDGTDGITETIANFPAGSSLTYTITGTAPATGTVTNTASVEPPDGVPDLYRSNNSDTVKTDIGEIPTTADLAILKYGPARVAPGAEVTYTLVVTNAGYAAADRAVLTDQAVTGLTKTGTPSCQATGGAICPDQAKITNELLEGAGVVIPTLPSGGSLRFVVTASVVPASGSVINTASIAPPDGVKDPNPTNDSASATTEVGPMSGLEADLALVKTGPSSVAAGGTVTYDLLVSNKGPADADGARVLDLVPAVLSNVSWICASPTGGAVCPTLNPNPRLGNVAMTIPTFPPGSTLTITVTGTAPEVAAFVNSAQVIPPADIIDPDPSNNPGGPVITQIPTVTLSGVVFNDNGTGSGTARNGVRDGGEVEVNPGGLHVAVLDGARKVLAVVPVDDSKALGAWSAVVPAGSDYTTYTTIASPPLGTRVPPPVAHLPAGWATTAETKDRTNNDGSPDGILSELDANVSINTLDFGIEVAAAAVLIDKTLYSGHDSGGEKCNTSDAQDTLILVVPDADRPAKNITWCFKVTNTGDQYLGFIGLTDGIKDGPLGNKTLADFQLKSPSVLPATLAPGESLVWYYQESRNTSLINSATVTMSPTDELGNPTGDKPVSNTDGAATFAYVYDPPYGIKTGKQIAGQNVIRWTMVWINDSPIVTEDVEISDIIPTGMTYRDGTLRCIPNNVTTDPETPKTIVKTCEYDGMVHVVADFGPDLGHTLAENNVNHALEVSFDVTIDNPNVSNSYQNQGTASWDCNKECAEKPHTIVTDDPLRPGEKEPTPIQYNPPPVSIPTLSEWAILLLGLMLIGMAWRTWSRFEMRE